MGHKSLAALILLWLLCQTTLAQSAFDPMTICVGVRALGMGKTYVAAADDMEAVFTNPAALGAADGFKLTSFSGKELEDINYSILGGAYPLGGRSALGIGYAASGISGIDIRNSSGILLKTSNFNSSVIIAGYGKKLNDTLSLGISYKIFSQGGSEVSDANGNASNLDIGILQKGPDWLSLGVVGQNILSSNQMRCNSAEAESLPQGLKVGMQIYLLGEEFDSAAISPVKLIFSTDADLSLTGSKPTTLHSGIEFSPIVPLTLRCGMDQSPAPDGIQSVYTTGVSLVLSGLGFHYAYHPSGDTAAHYFGLTFDERGWPLDIFPGTYISQVK
jgi:hypothetical protein